MFVQAIFRDSFKYFAIVIITINLEKTIGVSVALPMHPV